MEFGPGTLTFGETADLIEASCLVNSLRITMSKDEGDSTTKLCGTVKPGKITYTYAMSGNLDTDVDDGSGLFALTQAAPGTQVPFTFTPNTDGETSATGVVILDPMDFGADEFGDTLASDIEWTLVGKPTYTYPVTPLTARKGPLVINGRAASGVTTDAAAPAPAKASKASAAS